MMKKMILTLATTSLLSGAAVAHQQDPKLPHQQASKVSPYQAVQPGQVTRSDYKGYRFTRLPNGVDAEALRQSGQQPLLAGTEMENTLTGKPAYVSGVVSVVISAADPEQVAAQLGLVVYKRYDRMNVALLKAPEGTDMLALKQQLKQIDGVNSADIEIVEELRQTN